MRPALILFFIVLTACGSGGGGSGGSSLGACATAVNRGSWQENGGAFDEYVFRSNCTGTNKDCGLTFTYNKVEASQVGSQISLQITASNGGACPAVGTSYDCNWSVPGASQLILNCGGTGNIQFSKTAEAP